MAPRASTLAVWLWQVLGLLLIESSGTTATCLPQKAAHDALGAAWNTFANYTFPCGSRKHCPGVLSTFTSSFTAAANARINATRGMLEFDKLMEAQWSNGFLPHAYFSVEPRDITKSPGTRVDETSRKGRSGSSSSSPPPAGPPWHGLTPGAGWWGGKPQTNMDGARVWTSGMASPPIQATSALQIYLYLYHAKPSGTAAHEFFINAFTRLHAWHAYLHNLREVMATALSISPSLGKPTRVEQLQC